MKNLTRNVEENCSLFHTFTDDNAVYYYSSYSESGDDDKNTIECRLVTPRTIVCIQE